jgi:hypothetical protein
VEHLQQQHSSYAAAVFCNSKTVATAMENGLADARGQDSKFVSLQPLLGTWDAFLLRIIQCAALAGRAYSCSFSRVGSLRAAAAAAEDAVAAAAHVGQVSSAPGSSRAG